MLSLSSLTFIGALAALVQVQATFYVTAPYPPTQCYVGQPCLVSWFTTNSDPVDDNVGLCAVSLHLAENQEKVEGLTTVNINQDDEFQFIPAVDSAPISQEYYINFTSLSPVGSPPQYFEMFSPYFIINNFSSIGVLPTSTITVPGATGFPTSVGSSFAVASSSLVLPSGSFSFATTVIFSGSSQMFSSSPASPASASTRTGIVPAPNVGSTESTFEESATGGASQSVGFTSASGTILSVAPTSFGGSDGGATPESDGALNPQTSAQASPSSIQPSSAMSLRFNLSLGVLTAAVGFLLAYII